MVTGSAEDALDGTLLFAVSPDGRLAIAADGRPLETASGDRVIALVTTD
jgi:hypothetical protein